MARFICALALLSACSADSSPSTPAPTPAATPIRVLMVTTTLGFRHDSIPAARDALTALATRTGAFTVAATEEVGAITAVRLSSVDVLMFALTTGELPFDAAQRAAIVDFVNRGGGFVGIHSATDTLYEWPEYERLVGAYFKEHPWTQPATVQVENGSHPAVSGVPARFTLLEEFYTFRTNPRPSVNVLLSLDPSSVGASGDFPLAWTQTIGSGRSYYNALGHFSETWSDARFVTMLDDALRWAAGGRASR